MNEHSTRSDESESDGCSELRGMTAVVTGSSSGIGRAIALALANAGAAVVVHGRQNRSGVEQTVAEIERSGGRAFPVLADLADRAQRSSLMNAAWNWNQQVDIWVNNAGADVLTGQLAGASFDEKLEHLWRVDVSATVELSRGIGDRMRRRGSGTIINIGWDQAEQGMAGDSGEMFSTIKGAVMAFTRSLAQSLAPEVRVNAIAPGWIRTAWGEQASAYWQQRAQRESLLQRWGTPEDVAGAVRFLASPAAAFITGQILPVNGGFRYSAGTF